MPNFNQQAEKAYKKLQNLATTGLSGTVDARFTFNEPFQGALAINPAQIWLEYHYIPNIAPGGTNGQVIGVVQRFINLRLKSVAGTTNSFYHESLRDCIPHVFGNQISYNISLKDGSGANISFGQGDWEIDGEAGVLTFFGSVPTGVGTNYPTNTPQISFYRYVGAKGNSVVYLSSEEESSTSGINNYAYTSSLTGAYTPNAIYLLKPSFNNTDTATININNLGAKSIKKFKNGTYQDLKTDDLKANINYILIYDRDSDVMQLFSGGGGSGAGSAINIEITTPATINYDSLGIEEIGSVQFYEKSGNIYNYVNADIEIQEIAKTITIETVESITGVLKIVGNGSEIDAGTNGSTSGIAPYLNDLADVDTDTVNINETIVWNGTNWVNMPFQSQPYINTTYSELESLVLSNSLIAGMRYRFEHTTKHIINNTTDVINTGTPEYLYITASSTNTFFPIAMSELYPNDVLYYNFFDNLCEDDSTSREGKITYRLDTIKNNSTYYDFRNVKFRRWYDTTLSGNYSLNDNGEDFEDYYTFDVNSTYDTHIELMPEILYNNLVILSTSINNKFGMIYDSTIDCSITSCEFLRSPRWIILYSTFSTSLENFKLFVKNENPLVVDIDTVNLNNIIVDMIDSSNILWYKTVDTFGNITTESLN